MTTPFHADLKIRVTTPANHWVTNSSERSTFFANRAFSIPDLLELLCDPPSQVRANSNKKPDIAGGRKMGIHSRNRCERHRWVEGAWDHWSALWPSSISSSVAKVHAGSVRLAFIIIVSLLGAFLLSAVGSVSEAEAGASIIRFDGGSKVQRLRIPVDKSDTIRLEQPFFRLPTSLSTCWARRLALRG